MDSTYSRAATQLKSFQPSVLLPRSLVVAQLNLWYCVVFLIVGCATVLYWDLHSPWSENVQQNEEGGNAPVAPAEGNAPASDDPSVADGTQNDVAGGADSGPILHVATASVATEHDAEVNGCSPISQWDTPTCGLNTHACVFIMLM